MEIIELQRDLDKHDPLGSWIMHIIRNQAFQRAIEGYDITALIISKGLYDEIYLFPNHLKFPIEISDKMIYPDDIRTEDRFDFILRTDKGDFHYIINRDISKERDDYINDILNS